MMIKEAGRADQGPQPPEALLPLKDRAMRPACSSFRTRCAIDLGPRIRIFRASSKHPPAVRSRWPAHCPRDRRMAKPASIKIRLNSSADTGYFYVAKKNARTKTDKLVLKKYDPVVRKHVEFKEGKIK
jgi:large subunit ribosomal protein L33